MFPLALAKSGEKWTIQKLQLENEIKNRFMELGFCEGTEISITSAEKGSLIIKNKNSSYAIDKDFAKKIYIG